MEKVTLWVTVFALWVAAFTLGFVVRNAFCVDCLAGASCNLDSDCGGGPCACVGARDQVPGVCKQEPDRVEKPEPQRPEPPERVPIFTGPCEPGKDPGCNET